MTQNACTCCAGRRYPSARYGDVAWCRACRQTWPWADTRAPWLRVTLPVEWRPEVPGTDARIGRQYRRAA